MPRPRLSIEWIKGPNCRWPDSVKRQAVVIIKLRADVIAMQQKFNAVNMMSPEKIQLGELLASKQSKLAVAYSNLSKELTFHLANTAGSRIND